MNGNLRFMGDNPGLSPEALARLIDSRAKFLAFLSKRVDSQAAAEDILQAAFLRGIEKGNAIRDEESVVAWFYRLLRNAIIDYYRERGARDQASQTLIHHFEDHQVPDDLASGEICQCITGLLETVKPDYKTALKTIDINEGSLADLAASAGISANNAAVRIHRARQALRRQVTAACGACATHGCIDCTCKSKTSTTISGQQL